MGTAQVGLEGFQATILSTIWGLMIEGWVFIWTSGPFQNTLTWQIFTYMWLLFRISPTSPEFWHLNRCYILARINDETNHFLFTLLSDIPHYQRDTTISASCLQDWLSAKGERFHLHYLAQLQQTGYLVQIWCCVLCLFVVKCWVWRNKWSVVCALGDKVPAGQQQSAGWRESVWGVSEDRTKKFLLRRIFGHLQPADRMYRSSIW